MSKLPLRAWQQAALPKWRQAGDRGIISVVTGGGKTVFALSCIDEVRADTSLVVVPTLALLDQWWEEAAAFFDLSLDEINIITGREGMRKGTINLVVLNTAARLQSAGRTYECFLVVDECHKAASPQFRSILEIKKIAALGLSATPERPYDAGLDEVLIPALGPVVFEYSYRDARRDGVIVPFSLRNIVFELESDRQQEYDKLTKAIARAIDKYGPDAPETVMLFLRRTRVMNLSLNRVRLAVRLVAAHRGQRVLVFHENIEACDLIHQVLIENGVSSSVYHSKIPLRQRAEILSAYRHGKVNVLITCRALDEGFNVPETEIGIVAASTATRRQRIQRLGRLLRPAAGKDAAVVYTLVATSPEVGRLQEEELAMDGVADVSWSRS